MRLLKFRIQKYKSIIDSNWINVSPLTVLVGKNEAGKTTLLKALHKLKPSSPEPYNIDKEWPRGYRKERDVNQIICTAIFELADEEKKYLLQLTNGIFSDETVSVTRNYKNELKIELPAILNEDLAPTPEEVAEKKALKEEVNKYLIQQLPTFIYMSDYKAFNGSAHLEVVKDRLTKNQATDEDNTLLMILNLSGLDLDQEIKKGASGDREQRQYDLDDASATLTKTISERWKQRKYEVQFRADGHLFYTFVKDGDDPSLIKLEERSKGFQWFFSFDLMFMYESQGTFKNCVILLDEPGLHLHPDGQKDLLRRLEAYAKDNTLLYSTHLPFMIDLQKPDGIRVLAEDEKGAIVTEELNQSQPEAKFVLQAALGMSGSTSYLIANKNLIVEGVDDYWLLSELSSLFIRSGREGLNEDILITPAGGASEAVYIATFMIGQKLDVFVLLDTDQAGNDAKEKLIKKWLTKYNENKSGVFTLSEILETGTHEFAVEDLFPEEYYKEKVVKIYSTQLAALNIQNLSLTGSDMLAQKVKRALNNHGINLNKGSVAKIIRKEISQMKSISDLPTGTVEKVEKVFSKINQILS